jgi:hypothetical protein
MTFPGAGQTVGRSLAGMSGSRAGRIKSALAARVAGGYGFTRSYGLEVLAEVVHDHVGGAAVIWPLVLTRVECPLLGTGLGGTRWPWA